MNFASIAPYLQDPLVLIGFFIFIAFLFLRALLKAGVVPQLSQTAGYRILRSVLLYGFVLGLALTILGFGLKYRELSQSEQQHAVQLLKQELEGNLEVLAELKLNTETIVKAATTIQSALRTPNLKIMMALFPVENTSIGADVPASSALAGAAWSNAESAGLFNNDVEKRKFSAAAQAISGVVERTLPTIKSLSDPERARYKFVSVVWMSQLAVLRKIDIIDVTVFQRTYQELEVSRGNYDVVMARCNDYLTSVRDFLTPNDGKITQPRLAAVLSAERLYVQVVVSYLNALLVNIKNIERLASGMSVPN